MIEQVARASWQRALIGAVHRLPAAIVSGNCVAFYARNSSRFDQERCLTLLVEQFRLLGKQPDLIGLSEEAGQMISFDVGMHRLRKEGWSGKGAVSVKASRPVGGFVSGYYISVAFSPFYLFFCFGEDIGRFCERYFRFLAQRFYDVFDFEYGIAYRRPLRLGADIYALGMTAGLGDSPEDRLEARSIAKWFHALHFFQSRGDSWARHLRDVFQLNFLSAVHLQHHVDGKELRDWIAESSSRGRLESWAADRYVWTIPRSDIPGVRDGLKAASLLVAYRRDVPPLDDG